MKTIFVLLAGLSGPLLIILILWLNSLLMDRETRLILAGKKDPWILKGKAASAKKKKALKNHVKPQNTPKTPHSDPQNTPKTQKT